MDNSSPARLQVLGREIFPRGPVLSRRVSFFLLPFLCAFASDPLVLEGAIVRNEPSDQPLGCAWLTASWGDCPTVNRRWHLGVSTV